MKPNREPNVVANIVIRSTISRRKSYFIVITKVYNYMNYTMKIYWIIIKIKFNSTIIIQTHICENVQLKTRLQTRLILRPSLKNKQMNSLTGYPVALVT